MYVDNHWIVETFIGICHHMYYVVQLNSYIALQRVGF
jgi:hypothetical protein